MAFCWKEPERLQKFDKLLRRYVRCTYRILFNQVLRVDQSQAPVFIFKFSDDRCGIIECLVARSNSSEVFQGSGFAWPLVNRVPKTTLGRGFENHAI